MMEHVSEWVSIVGGVVSAILLPVVSTFLYHDQKKRKEEAAARKAEGETITGYAAEWRKNYEEEKATNKELNAKIDQLYAEKNDDRNRIRELMSRNQQLELENQALKFKKCEVRGCKDRRPPSDY